MNRSIIAIGLILVMLLSFTSCNLVGTEDPNYQTLNELVKKLPENYTLIITVESGNGNTVTEKYNVTGESVQYKVERINAFTHSGDSYNVPDSYKTVEEKVLTPEEQKKHDYSIPNFKFIDSALEAPTKSGGTLNANIISIKNFMGKDIDGENAVLKVSYSPNKIGYISVSYTTENGNRVTIKYTF